jgi:hypothetical protein
MPLTRAWAAPGRWRRHALVLALAHLHVSKGPTGCSSRAHPLRLARSGIFFANLTKRVLVINPGSPPRFVRGFYYKYVCLDVC